MYVSCLVNHIIYLLILCLLVLTNIERSLLRYFTVTMDFAVLHFSSVKFLLQILWSRLIEYHFSSVQSLSSVQLFATPWISARQASLSITTSRSSLRLRSIESVMPSSHLIFCHPLLLLPSIPPSIRVFSDESALRMRWPKYWSFSFNIIPSKEIPGLISSLHSKKMGKQWLTLFFWAPKSLQMVTAAMKLKDAYSLEGKLWPT